MASRGVDSLLARGTAAESKGIMGMELKVGDPIVFVDEHRVSHAALVTRTWESVGGLPGVNCVYVSDDEAKGDQYGRQIERRTSVCHLSVNAAKANAWHWPDETV